MRRPFFAHLCSLAMLCAVLVGCTSEREVYARTQLLLRIDTSDEAIRGQLSALKVALFAEGEDDWEPGSSAQFEADSVVFPVELPVVPSRGSKELGRSFEVVVDVLDGKKVVAQARAVTRFIEGKQLVLSLYLERCEGASELPVCAEPDCHGSDCKTCKQGACVRAEPIDPEGLPEWSEVTASAQAPDAGTNPADARVRDGAPRDGSKDTSSESCREDDDGKLRCVMGGSPLRERCEAGSWKASDACADGQTCDLEAAEAGSCRELVEVCAGSSEQTVCDREVMHFCDGKGGSAKNLPCKSAAQCERGREAGACAVCLPNEHRCTGAKLESCAEDGQSFVAKESCDSAALCNAAAGSCSMGCKAGMKSCSGDDLSVCNGDGTAFMKEASCEPGLCDAVGQQCDKCVPATKSCEGNSVQTCSSDGQSVTQKACEAPRGICTGNGTCVQCTATQPCAASSDPCLTAACNVATGTCETTPKEAGTACPSGFCDGQGKCGECKNGETKACGSDVGQCTLGKQSCSAGRWSACSGGTAAGLETCNGMDDDCDGTNDDGAICLGTRNRCIGGRCVQCGTGAACPSGQGCSADGLCETLCGNSKRDATEQCDPTAPGETTFSCTADCRPRKIFEPCSPDLDNPFGSGDCGAGYLCGSVSGELANCQPLDPCPTLTGYEWQLWGNVCVLPCSTSSQCPIPVINCVANPVPGASPIAWCRR